MGNVLVLLPVKPVAKWIADLLRSCGYSTAVAESVEDLSRLLCFVRFDAVVAWLPSKDLDALVMALQSQSPSRPSLVILSCAPATHLTVPWFRRGIDRLIVLPMSSSALLEVMRGAVPQQISRAEILPFDAHHDGTFQSRT